MEEAAEAPLNLEARGLVVLVAQVVAVPEEAPSSQALHPQVPLTLEEAEVVEATMVWVLAGIMLIWVGVEEAEW